jgi:hypothetical protein
MVISRWLLCRVRKRTAPVDCQKVLRLFREYLVRKRPRSHIYVPVS